MKSNNPIIKGKGVCDPHIHIFNDKAYLYASHDLSPENTDFSMKDWQIWSSDNLVNWNLESTIRPEDTYMGESSKCWAPDAAERNGKYYFCFSNGSESTGVMVSDNPGKGFVAAKNEPLLDGTLTPTAEYDPSVFIDDDENKTPYIVFGTPEWANGDSYYIAKLNDDMISLAESPRKIELNDIGDDKPWLHKYNGVYYLSWASYYATSNNIYGPYAFRGNFRASSDHGSIFEWKNQWFNAFTIYDPTMFHRASGLCYIHYRKNGEMVADQMIVEFGVGQYDANWNKIEAEWFMETTDGILKTENTRLGFDVTNVTNGSRIYFPQIHNIPENASVMFYAVNGNEKPAKISIKDYSDRVLGECVVEPIDRWDQFGYRTHTCKLNNRAGTNDIYLEFQGDGDDLLHLDYFKFYSS